MKALNYFVAIAMALAVCTACDKDDEDDDIETVSDLTGGDLSYSITGSSTVEVTKCNNQSSLQISIPENIKYDGQVYEVTSIGKEAFESCNDMTSVTIPKSVTSIGWSAFAWCYNLTRVDYQGSIEDWLNIDFSFNEANPLIYASQLYIDNEEVKDLIIPITITEIKNHAFEGYKGLTSVTIPNSVTSIGNYAFSGCDNLASVIFEENSKLTNIVQFAFEGCIGLTSITIPNSVTSIGYNAFGRVKNVIYNGTAEGSPWYALTINGIVDGDFIYADAEKTKLTAYIGSEENVVVPNSVTSIGDFAFAWCDLKTVSISNSITSVGYFAFIGCNNLLYNEYDNAYYLGNSDNPYLVLVVTKSTYITRCEINSKCRFICDNAFFYCKYLTSIDIPNSVTSIGISAFVGCTELESVTVNWSEPIELQSDIFTKYGTLYVPVGTADKYKATDVWKEFNIVEQQ